MEKSEMIEEEESTSLLWRDTGGAWCSRLFPLLIFIMCLGALLFIPLKILSEGFLPGDDALRHAAYAMTDKTWDQVLVSDGPVLDVHSGWHSFLRIVRGAVGIETADGLVSFEIAFLFLLFAIPPLFLVKRPEAWIISLLLVYCTMGFGTRQFLGRPFVASMAMLLCMLLSREKLNQKKIPWGILSFLGVGLVFSVWWRMTWFLYLFPIVTFFAARQWRGGIRLLVLLAIAVVVGSALCGDAKLPFASLGAVLDVFSSANHHVSALVVELKPRTKFSTWIIGVSLILISTHLRGGSIKERLDSPVFFILAGSCFLATQAMRWFEEFGTVAFLVLLVEEVDAWMSQDRYRWFSWFSWSRFAIVSASVALLFVCYTADEDGRWSSALKREYVVLDDPQIQEGLPEKDGIIYSTSMSVFYQTFFKHPHASWHYMLGFEAAFMPEDDLKVLRLIQWNNGASKMYKPWVEKMRPQDRMWVERSVGASAPSIEGLEWVRVTSYIWSGRKVQK